MAPAGGPEAGCAALHYGADAIYLGLPRFSARAEAVNFTLADVEAITAYAHSLAPRRRVFAAVNTLILDAELDGVIEDLDALSAIGVDALIVQDLGVYRLARRHFPGFRLHASTQLAVHNRAGVEALRDLGFHRATLARELTMDEVRACAAVPGIETEVFIHGALCYAYSGLCLMSSHLTGRSGNRGRCAYLCRDRFTVEGADEGRFLFNMNDLALPDHLPALRDAGVASVKIEGRMKSPLYVAAAVRLYRRLLDGPVSPVERAELEADLRSVFSRPWTALHAAGRRAAGLIDPETVGHRGAPVGVVLAVRRDRRGAAWLRFQSDRPIERHDGLQIDLPGQERPFGFGVEELRLNGRPVFEVPAGALLETLLPAEAPPLPPGARVYCASSQAVKRRFRWETLRPGAWRARRAIDIRLDILEDKVLARGTVEADPPLTVDAEAPGPFAPARKADGLEAAARGAFEKLGDTPFALGAFSAHNPGGLFVPVSRLNELRRALVRELQARVEKARRERVLAIQTDVASRAVAPVPGPLRWSVKTDDPACLAAMEEQDWAGVEEVVVELRPNPPAEWTAAFDALAGRLGRDRIRLALPLIARAWEERALAETIARLRGGGWSKWEASGVASWAMVRDVQDWTADWPVYVMNRAAARQALALGARRVTLSPEDSADNMSALLHELGDQASIAVYQDTPLFISDNCIYAGLEHSCPGPEACKFKNMAITSSHHDKLEVIDRKCRMVVIAKAPYCLSGQVNRLKENGARRVRVDFVYRTYTPEQAVDIWRKVRAGRPLAGARTGNFERALREKKD